MGSILLRAIRTSLFILLITVSLLELALQIYNPIPLRVVGGQFNLIPNLERSIENVVGVEEGLLPELAVKQTNELGFLGDSLDVFSSASIRIITIGGSTTECYFLGDGQTWPAQMQANLEKLLPGLSVSVINAGLDGHSTFGHVGLLKHFKDIFYELRPTHIMVMAGINDFGLWDQKPRRWDLKNTEVSLLKKSVLFNLINSYLKADVKFAFRNERERVLQWQESKLLSKEVFGQRLQSYEEAHLASIERAIKEEGGYSARLNEISRLIVEIGASPVFIGQVAAYGDYIDPTTGVNMATLNLGDWSGLTRSLALEQYNSAMAKVAALNGKTYIPLGDILPKDSKYFYDEVHFGLEGAKRVGDILARAICCP